MSLAERLSNPPRTRQATRCQLCLAMALMDDDTRQAVEDAVYGDGWSDRALAEELAKDGFDVVKASISNHRQADHGGRR